MREAAAGASLQPLFDAHRAFVLGAQVLHADETPVRMLDPGAGKTSKAYVWAYARGEHDAIPGVVYDFCVGRGAKYPMAFLEGWAGTITCDDYKGYDAVFRGKGEQDRIEAGCLAHARRKFDELAKAHASPVAMQAIERIAWLYRLEQEAREMNAPDRLRLRQEHAQRNVVSSRRVTALPNLPSKSVITARSAPAKRLMLCQSSPTAKRYFSGPRIRLATKRARAWLAS